MVKPGKKEDGGAASGSGQAPKRTRSRFGCWPCKARKVKCGEEKPECSNCLRQGEKCDYGVRLNWSHAGSGIHDLGGGVAAKSAPNTPSMIVFPSPDVFSGQKSSAGQQFQASQLQRPQQHQPKQKQGREMLSVEENDFDSSPRKGYKLHGRSRSNVGTPVRDTWDVDPGLRTNGGNGLLAVDDSGIRNGAASFSDPNITTSHSPSFQHTRSLPVNQGSSLFSTDSSSMPNIMLNQTHQSMPSIFTTMSPPNNLQGQDDEGGYFETQDRSKRQRLSNYGSPTMGVKYESPEQQLDGNTIQTTSPTSDLPSGSSTAPFTFSSGSTPTTASNAQAVPVSFYLGNAASRHSSRGDNPHNIKFRMTSYRSYGYDTGHADRDIPHNDDMNAIVGSPAIAQSNSFGGPDVQTVSFALDNYYENPVQINIPKSLEPLPKQLTSNPMNLLYFHHFLNHVARILTPHDCPINPYRTVLPKMAVEDPDLLNLVLAYSACHRARLLAHPEPKVRILNYVANVFSRLAEAFKSPEIVSSKHVATAIMLASLEIISPQAFEHKIPWYTYLSMARDMFAQRKAGIYANQERLRFNHELFFLCRWYGYLDIMGSMSGAYRSDPLEFDVYWLTNEEEGEGTIDCLLGCTMHCMRLLGESAKLIKETQRTRFDEAKCRVKPRWQPSLSQRERAQNLIKELEASSNLPVVTCPHESIINSPVEAAGGVSGGEHSTDLKELMSVNIIYHWAGIIQLHRRVLNTPSESRDVIYAIDRIIEQADTIRPGSPAEACLLFPVFTAGCEAKDEERIEPFRRRMADISGLGMRQMDEAREIMEKVWETNELWENIVKDEFIG